MTPYEYDDFAAIVADDALLDALGTGDVNGLDVDLSASDEDLALLLAQWRHELDTAVTAHPARGAAVVVGPPELVPTAGRGWWRRHAAGVVAASVVVLAGSTGVAAAQSGQSGPLATVHRVLFGAPAPSDTATIVRITGLLDGVTVDLDKARAQGGATAARIADMSDRLDDAGRLLAGDAAAPDALTARLIELRADLAALDTVPTSPPGVGDANGGQSARFHGGSATSGRGEGSSTDADSSGRDGPNGGAASSDGPTDVDGDHDGDTATSGGDGSGSGSGGDVSADGSGSGSGSGDGSSTGGGSGSDGGTSGSGSTLSGDSGGSSGPGDFSGSSSSGG